MSKRGSYGKWSDADLTLAVSAVASGSVGLNEAARRYGVPKATLKRHLDRKNKDHSLKKHFGRPTVFTEEMEKELAAHILKFEERMFGLSIIEVRKLAFQVASLHGVQHCFSVDKKMAGKKWYYNFMKRNPNLSLRQPEATSLARMKGFSKERVHKFFDILENIIDIHKLSGNKIYDVDESGFTTVQKKNPKIVGLKGKHQVGAVSSGERGVNTTIVCCVNAAGSFVPPMFIFKRKRHAPELERGAPAGSKVEISDSGYITSELFIEWLNLFKRNVVCSKEDPVLLLLDGHVTHCKNLDALIFARDNGIIMVQLPSHTTHRMQPLDVAFFGPLGIYYTQAQEKFLRQNVGTRITQYDVVALLTEAYGRAATVNNAESGFRSTGIWPVNRHIFQDHDFAPSDALNPITAAISPSKSSTLTFSDTLIEAAPIPQVIADLCKKRKQQDAEVLTSTPYKNSLEEQIARKKELFTRITKKTLFNKKNPNKNQKPKKLFESSSETSDEFKASGSSSGGEEFMLEEQTRLVDEGDFGILNFQDLKTDDFVLVGLKDEKGKNIYYVGQITKDKKNTPSLEISFLRKSRKVTNAFVFPVVLDVALVDDSDIKMKLPPPKKLGQTKRQQSFLSFPIEFNFEVR